MNQFVILTDISTQQILNHTELQFHNNTLIRSGSLCFNSSIHSEQKHTKIKLEWEQRRTVLQNTNLKLLTKHYTGFNQY